MCHHPAPTGFWTISSDRIELFQSIMLHCIIGTIHAFGTIIDVAAVMDQCRLQQYPTGQGLIGYWDLPEGWIEGPSGPEICWPAYVPGPTTYAKGNLYQLHALRIAFSVIFASSIWSKFMIILFYISGYLFFFFPWYLPAMNHRSGSKQYTSINAVIYTDMVMIKLPIIGAWIIPYS